MGDGTVIASIQVIVVVDLQDCEMAHLRTGSFESQCGMTVG